MPDSLNILNRNDLYANEEVRTLDWRALHQNQNWIYGRVSPIHGELAPPGDTDGVEILRKVVVPRKPRSSSGAVADTYVELILVIYGDNAIDVEWEVRTFGWVVVDSITDQVPPGPGFSVSRVTLNEGQAYYVTCTGGTKKGEGLKAAFIAWPYLSELDDLPK